MAKKKSRRTKRKPRFDFNIKRILATMVAGFIGIGIVEFIVGSAFMADFMSSPVYNSAAGLTGFISYIIGASVIFGVVFYLLEQTTIPKTKKITTNKIAKIAILITLLIFLTPF